MTTPPIEDTKTLIKTKVLEMVRTSWNEDKKVTLLATIGSVLRKEFDLRKELNGVKLAEFIRKEMSELQFVDSPKDSLIKALAPSDATLDDNIANHFKSSDASQISNEVDYKRVNINRSLWKAFSVELASDYYRHVKLKPKIHFEDSPSPTLSGHYLIKRELINPEDIDNKQQRDSIIQSNILEWARTNQIDSGEFLLRVSENSYLSEKLTVYDALVGALNSNELSRISIPLDIVLKLQNKYL